MSLLLLPLLLACGSGPKNCRAARFRDPGAAVECRVPEHRDRPMTVHVPESYDDETPVPVVLLLHGGGSDAEGGEQMTCPDGDTDSAQCLSQVGPDRGYLVVFVNGTASLASIRTFNAGGGSDGWQCLSGKACADGVDDIAYFDAVLDELEADFAVDTDRVYATGHSNGAAMSHRLACQRAERFTAVAANAAPNQYSTTASCEPTRPVPLLQMHGTDDLCMPYEGGNNGCLVTEEGLSLGIEESTAGWVAVDGCEAEPTVEDLPDTTDDGTTSTLSTWRGCDGGVEVRQITITGGGHAWPGGTTLTDKGGTIAQDFQGNEAVLDFFDLWSMP